MFVVSDVCRSDVCRCIGYSHWSCLLSDPADKGYYSGWSRLFWLLALMALVLITRIDRACCQILRMGGITCIDHACSDYSHWSRLISLFTMITLVLITHTDHACSDYSHWSCLFLDPADGWHGRVLHPPLQRRHLQPRVRKEGEKLKNIYNFLVSLITKSQVFCSLYFRTLFYSCVSQHGNKNV